MAKLQSESIKISVSRLLRDSDKESALLTMETLSQLEAIIQELVGGDVLVELTSASE